MRNFLSVKMSKCEYFVRKYLCEIFVKIVWKFLWNFLSVKMSKCENFVRKYLCEIFCENCVEISVEFSKCKNV